MLHRLRAERAAERSEHGPRVPQRGLDIRPLAVRDPAQELVDVQRLSVRLGVDERLQLGRQLLENVPGLSSGEALGQGLQGRLGGALGRVPAQPATRLADRLDDLLVVHTALRGARRSRPTLGSLRLSLGPPGSQRIPRPAPLDSHGWWVTYSLGRMRVAVRVLLAVCDRWCRGLGW